jgi:hypothetical protein
MRLLCESEAVNTRLCIARELAPMVGDTCKAQMGGKLAAAHVASPACSHAAYMAPDARHLQLAAAGPAAAGPAAAGEARGRAITAGRQGTARRGAPIRGATARNLQGREKGESLDQSDHHMGFWDFKEFGDLLLSKSKPGSRNIADAGDFGDFGNCWISTGTRFQQHWGCLGSQGFGGCCDFHRNELPAILGMLGIPGI